jgi:phage shock protein A
MEQALGEMIASRAVAQRASSVDGVSGAAAGIRADQLEQGFNRTMTGATGVAGLHTGPASADPSLLRRLETLHKEQRISERVARLKAVNGRPVGEDA